MYTIKQRTDSAPKLMNVNTNSSAGPQNSGLGANMNQHKQPAKTRKRPFNKSIALTPLEIAVLRAELEGRRRENPEITDSQIIRECILGHLKTSVHFPAAMKELLIDSSSQRLTLQRAVRLVRAMPEIAEMVAPPVEEMTTQKFAKTATANLYLYKPSGAYYVRAKVGGRPLRKSLRTRSYEVAQARLKELLEKERAKASEGDERDDLAAGI